MNELPKGFFQDDIYCFPTGFEESKTFSWLPGTPAFQRRADKPMVTLLITPQGAELAMTTCWSVPEERKPQLKAACEQHDPSRAPASLQPPELDNPQVTLTLRSGEEHLRTFEPTTASGFGQYQAVLKATLDTKEKGLVSAALNGQQNTLLLSYETTLSLLSRAHLTGSGDLAPDLKTLAPIPKKGIFGKDPVYPTLEQCKDQAQKSLKAQRLTSVWRNTPNVSTVLSQKVEADLIDKIANELYTTIQQLGPDAGTMTRYDIKFTCQGSESHHYPIRRALDIGAWFADHPGEKDTIEQAPSPGV